MTNLVETINAIEKRLKVLVKQKEAYRREVRSLEAQMNSKAAEINRLQDCLEAMENNNKSLKAANAMLGSNDYKRETKLKINSLIREIDQCIVQLSE